MEKRPTPVAFHCNDAVEYLEFLIQSHAAQSTIIICSSREAFQREVHASIRTNGDDGTSVPAEEDLVTAQHHLLIPRIQLLARSRTIYLVFTPTLQHLRAYLAAAGANSSATSRDKVPSDANIRPRMLATLGLLALHRDTSEFTAQGLSRSLSVAVDASMVLGRRLVLAEALPGLNHEAAATIDGNRGEVQPDPWMEQVPILNGSIRSRGDERIWAGRTVDLARVVGRWCRIVRLEENSEV